MPCLFLRSQRQGLPPLTPPTLSFCWLEQSPRLPWPSSPLARVSFPACISHQPAPWQMLFNSGNVVQQQRVLQSAEPAAFKRRFSPKMIHRYVDTEIAPPFVTPTGERGRGELSPEGSCRHWLLQCLSLCV